MVKMVNAKLNGEYKIKIPQHRADRPQWYTKEGWEKKRLASMYKNLTSADTIYYVGAEEGEMPALCQMWGAKVVMFEPNPKVWPNIKAIWDANKLSHPAGVFAGFASDTTEPAIEPMEFSDLMQIGDDGWPKCAHDEVVGNHGFKELDKEYKHFEQLKLDDYFWRTKIVPTAISIDVEGAEGRVLKGAAQILENFKPKIWLSGHPEFIHENFGTYLHELRVWLREFGYKEDLLDYDHEVHLFYHV